MLCGVVRDECRGICQCVCGFPVHVLVDTSFYSSIRNLVVLVSRNVIDLSFSSSTVTLNLMLRW